MAAEEAGRAKTTIDFGGGPVHGVLPARSIHGAPPGVRCQDPPLQVHRFDEHTFVLRQSKAVTYEAPFLYLLFGNDRALLLDTGAVADPRRMPVAGHGRPARRRVARLPSAPGLLSGRRAHPRPRRPRRRGWAVRWPAGCHGSRPGAAGGSGVLRFHQLAAADGPVQPRRARARGHRVARASPGGCHDLRPVERVPAYRGQHLPRAGCTPPIPRSSPVSRRWWRWPGPGRSVRCWAATSR